MGWESEESADSGSTERSGTASRGGIVRTLLCLFALAGYGATGWLAVRGTDLIAEAGGTVPDGLLATLNAPPEGVVGPLFLVAAAVVGHFAAGLLALALGVGGPARRPLLPPPAFDDRTRRNLRRGGLLLVGVAGIAAGLAALPFVSRGGFELLTAVGGASAIVLFVLYLAGALLVLSPLVPPVSSTRAGMVALLAGPALLAVDVAVRSGLRGDPVTRSAVALGVALAVVVGVTRPVATLVPGVAAARREWGVLALALLAALAAWSVGGIVAPALPTLYGVLALLVALPLVVLLRGYVVRTRASDA